MKVTYFYICILYTEILYQDFYVKRKEKTQQCTAFKVFTNLS